jgi:Secretion system C-terminal sorting domain
MKKIFTILTMFVMLQYNTAHAQFGNGSAGNITLTGAYAPLFTNLTSYSIDISGTSAIIGLQSIVGFAIGDQLLVYQQTGLMATSYAGNFIRARITGLSTFTGDATIVLEQPSTTWKDFDIGTESVVVFKLEQYDNISISGNLIPASGYYSIPLLAKSSIILTNGIIDVSANGGYAGDFGIGGDASLLTSIAGLAGSSIANNGGIGGNSGIGGTGIYGGGNGGALGQIGGASYPPNYTPYRLSNSTTIAKNASIPASKRFVMGEGGMESYGSKGSDEGAAGGGGSFNYNTFTAPTNGKKGKKGEAGNPGGIGSSGAGVVFLFTAEVAGLTNNTNIRIKALNAFAGGKGGDGGDGGDGGIGGGRDCDQVGGGGGGGNGGNGSNGAGGGNAGAGGAIYAYRMVNAPSGYPVFPINMYVNNGVALGGAGGAGGAGGSAGAFGGDANTNPLTLCIPIAPCATDTELQKTFLHVAAPFVDPLFIQDTYDHYIYHLNIGLPTEKITITQFWTFYNMIHTLEIFIDSFQTSLDCNGNSYKTCIVHNVYENTTVWPNTRDTVNYKLYTTNGTAADLTNYFINIDTLSRVVSSPLLSINNGFILTPAGAVWMLDCYSDLCNPTPALPGQPGLPGIAGLNGDPGVIDEDFFLLGPLAINTIVLSATKQGNNAKLNWSITNKNDLATMQILKSNDGVSFKKIKNILPNAQSGNTYTYTDLLTDEDYNHTVFYKINAVNNNQIETISNTTNIICNTTNSLSIYPNPTKTQFTITTNYNITEVEMYNINGQLVQTWGDEKTRTYQLHNIAKGVYYIKAKTKSNMYMQKIVVE